MDIFNDENDEEYHTIKEEVPDNLFKTIKQTIICI